jgi:hypothetical protein
MLRTFLVIFTTIFILSASASASSFLQSYISDAKAIGKARFNFVLWHVYDAVLYSSTDEFSFEKPFALELNYKRKLYGEKIAESSAEEIRNLGFSDEVKLAGWYSQMQKIFPDVENGTSITGIYQPNGATVFYKNSEKIGEVSDIEFGKWFFGIWFDEKTSQPEFRKKLLGIK